MYEHSSISVRHVKNAYSALVFSVSQTTHCFFRAAQLDERYFQNEPDYKYATIRMIIANVSDCGSYDYLISNSTESQKSNTIEITLDRGKYVLIVFADWQESIQDLKVSCYSEYPIEMFRVDTKKEPNLLEKVMIGYSSLKVELGLEQNVKKQLYVDEKCGLVLETFTNETSTPLTLYKSINSMDNLSLQQALNGGISIPHNNQQSTLSLQLVIPAGEKRALIFKKNNINTSHNLDSVEK